MAVSSIYEGHADPFIRNQFRHLSTSDYSPIRSPVEPRPAVTKYSAHKREINTIVSNRRWCVPKKSDAREIDGRRVVQGAGRKRSDSASLTRASKQSCVKVSRSCVHAGIVPPAFENDPVPLAAIFAAHWSSAAHNKEKRGTAPGRRDRSDGT